MKALEKECNSNKLSGAEFTLAIGCRLNCHYCPQDKLIRRYTDLYEKKELSMKFETFTKCLENIKQGGGVAFTGMVEPFHNKECAKMIKYAYDRGYKIWLATTLVDATEEDFEILRDVRFEDIQLRIPDKQGNSKFVITDEYLKIFQLFHESFIANGHLVYSCHGEIHDAIKSYLSRDIICSSAMMNRAGNLDYEDLRTYDHKGKIICACSSVQQTAGWSPEVLPNGTVILCCMDYGMEHILGNLALQKWSEILNGKEYLRYKQGLEDEKISILCRKCPMAQAADKTDFSDKNLYASNAMRVAKVVKNYIKGELSEDILNDSFSKRSIDIIKMLAEYIGGQEREICIFGLGKLFHDNYYLGLWNNVVPADVFSDNNQQKWGKEIRGVKCISPNELKNRENMLVITYVRDDSDIKKQLQQLGIKKIVNVYEIYNLLEKESND